MFKFKVASSLLLTAVMASFASASDINLVQVTPNGGYESSFMVPESDVTNWAAGQYTCLARHSSPNRRRHQPYWGEKAPTLADATQSALGRCASRHSLQFCKIEMCWVRD